MDCTLYAHDLQNNVYTVDCATGSLNLLYNLTAQLQALGVGTLLDIACNGNTMYAIAGNNLVRINLSTGQVTDVGSIGTFVNALAVASTGIIYAAGGGSFFSLDPTTGAATFIGNYGGGTGSSGDLAFDCNDNLYASVYSSIGEALASVDVTTGAATLIGPIGINSVYGLSFYCCQLYGVTGDGYVLTINTFSGQGTAIGFNNNAPFGGMTTCCGHCGCGC